MSTNVLRARACAIASPRVRACDWTYYSAETEPGEIGDAVGGVPRANVVGIGGTPGRTQSNIGAGDVGTPTAGTGFVLCKRAFSFFAARVIGEG
jgi:hypothetical protein